MKKITRLFLTLFFLIGIAGPDAYGVNVSLNDTYAVPCYIKSHYYDLVNHTADGVSFTTDAQTIITGINTTKNNVAWRDSYGAFNYATGNRSITINQSVQENDLIIIQGGSTNTNYQTYFSITNGEISTKVTDYYCLKVTSASETISLSFGRNTYAAAILIMTINPDASELELAQFDYDQAIEDYAAKYATTIDETYVDDNKPFWHPSSAVTAYTNSKTTINNNYNAALLSTGDHSTEEYRTAITTINGLITELASIADTYNNTINIPSSGDVYALKQVSSSKYMTFNSSTASLTDNVTGLFFTTATSPRVFVNQGNLKLQVAHSNRDNWSLYGHSEAGTKSSSEWIFIPKSATEYNIQTPTTSRYIGKSLYGNAKYTDEGILWTIEKIESQEITVSSAGLATYTPTVPLDFSSASNITAYKAAVSGTAITLTKVTTVAAGEGVLLRGKAGEETTEAIAVATSATTANAGNEFVPVTGEIDQLAETDGDYTNFVLNKVDGVVGFYKANNTHVAAGKAYLKVLTSTLGTETGKSMKLVFGDETTGITEVSNAAKASDKAYYTLSGQRVNAPVKGLYLHNGKKVIIK